MRTPSVFNRIALVLTLAAVAGAQGCKSAQKTPEDTAPSGDISAIDNTMGDSDSGKAMGLETVHFGYDTFALDAEGKRVLAANADILKNQSSVKIQVEGHCDQRGGIQYNIALGEKRANAVRRYLVDLGVSKDRMTVISYGKERPIDPGTSEDAYAKNRRANFVITSK
ncbi:peptidoglycan-associated lipoprotein Pal [bacterium]|jgi:peptidoglycan-associated lipoprotein|nr:peptidoglycan-associated lipoprotein Pal [bacterium]